MRKYAIVVLINALSAITLTMMLETSAVYAADDIQEITVGPHIFFIPKHWMTSGGVLVLAAGRGALVTTPQSGPIQAKTLGLQPKSDWQPFGPDRLPRSIDIDVLPSAPSQLDAQTKQWIEDAKARRPDSDGFVLVSATPFRPGEPPMYETYIYKDYLNSLGRPLIVRAEIPQSPGGNAAPSNVYIATPPDLSVHFRFDIGKFPKSEWWSLYQRTLAFLEHLQQPK